MNTIFIGNTQGELAIDHQTFYTRLGQKIIHILQAHTLSGKLYEVDMRLRPSGNSGLLVSSFKAFARYQQQDAWTWEHQALVRARPIVGSERLQERFIELRKNILQQPRQVEQLHNEVCNMRQKMRKNLGSRKKNIGFHLKQDKGGIVDIEFMVQYAVLAWSNRYPAVSQWTDNIRIIESLQNAGCLNQQQANQLMIIYKLYRTEIHRLALQNNTSTLIDECQFIHERQQIRSLWQQIMSKPLTIQQDKQ